MTSSQSLNDAVQNARQARETWFAQPLESREQILKNFADQLRQHKTDLREIISEETGKPRWESATEVDAMINKIPISIDAFRSRRRESKIETAGATATTRYKPQGVVAVLGPFNFPGHLPNGHIAPALLAGNTVLFKPSELTPRTADKTAELWQSAGLPQNVLTIIHGAKETGEALVNHREIDGIFFTGSFTAGRAINRALADHPGKIVALEMGGNNPLIVHNVKDLPAAAYMTIQSAYLTAGQRCSCARRLIVTQNAQPFLDELLAMMSKIRVGLYTDDPEPFMGPVINDRAAQKLLEAQDNLIKRGATPLTKLTSLRGFANLLTPALLDVTDVKDKRDEELFGPLLQLTRVNDLEQAIAEANNTQYGLAAGIITDDRSAYEAFYKKIRAGVVNWNRPLTGASSHLPFGGIKNSGNHRPSAAFAADYCDYPVASLESETLTIPKTPTPGIDL